MSDQERLDRLEAEGLAMHTPEFERDIAETMDGIFAQARRMNDAVSVKAARRERIATSIYAALMTGSMAVYVATGVKRADSGATPELAIELADELLGALDAAEARDREATP